MGFVRPLCLIGTAFAALLNFHYTHGFAISTPKSLPGRQSLSVLYAEEKLSYTERLRLAREAKAKGVPMNTAAPQPKRSEEQLKQFKQLAGSTDAEDDLPFSDQIYQDMAYVISKLQNRLKKYVLLTPEEVSNFKAAVDRIIADSNSKEQASPVSFMGELEPVVQESLEGVKVQMKISKDSQHYIEGMETMTPDEYRQAMDQKIRTVRTARREAGIKYGGRQLNDYFDSLGQ